MYMAFGSLMRVMGGTERLFDILDKSEYIFKNVVFCLFQGNFIKRRL